MSDPIEIQILSRPPVTIQFPTSEGASVTIQPPNQIQVQVLEGSEAVEQLVDTVIATKLAELPIPDEYVTEAELNQALSEFQPNTGTDLTDHLAAENPHPQYTLQESFAIAITGREPRGTAEGLIEAHEQSSNPHSQYALLTQLNSKASAGTAELLMEQHLTAANPHNQYVDGAELITALQPFELTSSAEQRLTNHLQASNPHSQYLTATSAQVLFAAIEARLSALEAGTPSGPTLHADAIAFRNRVIAGNGSISDAQLLALSVAAQSLADSGLRSKVLHLSPMVGDFNAAKQKFYRDASESSWELNLVGHSVATYNSAMGLIGGANRYALTDFIPSQSGWVENQSNGGHSAGMGLYISTNAGGTGGVFIDMGAIGSAQDTDQRALLVAGGDGSTVDLYSVLNGRINASGGLTGLVLASRLGSTLRLFNGSTQIATRNGNSGGNNRPSIPITFGALNYMSNGASFHSANTSRLFILTTGLTQSEGETLGQIITTLGAALASAG